MRSCDLAFHKPIKIGNKYIDDVIKGSIEVRITEKWKLERESFKKRKVLRMKSTNKLTEHRET